MPVIIENVSTHDDLQGSNQYVLRINDERIFIDEIPADWPTTNPIAPACDFLCHIVEKDMAA